MTGMVNNVWLMIYVVNDLYGCYLILCIFDCNGRLIDYKK